MKNWISLLITNRVITNRTRSIKYCNDVPITNSVAKSDDAIDSNESHYPQNRLISFIGGAYSLFFFSVFLSIPPYKIFYEYKRDPFTPKFLGAD